MPIKYNKFEKKKIVGYNKRLKEVVTLKTILSLMLISMLIIMSSCSSKSIKTEFDFANHLAQQDLWKEAYFRWNKLVEHGKESAALFNNMAIALEEKGDFEEAKKFYEKALELAPNNPTIQNNYKKFKKMLSKDVKDEDKKDENERKEKE